MTDPDLRPPKQRGTTPSDCITFCWCWTLLNLCERLQSEKICSRKQSKMNGEARVGMKRDEERVCGDFKGEAGWKGGRERERGEELVMERLAAQFCLRAFQPTAVKRGGDLSGATSFFELSAAEVAGRPGRRCDTIISVWRMAAGGRERQHPATSSSICCSPRSFQPPSHLLTRTPFFSGQKLPGSSTLTHGQASGRRSKSYFRLAIVSYTQLH